MEIIIGLVIVSILIGFVTLTLVGGFEFLKKSERKARAMDLASLEMEGRFIPYIWLSKGGGCF